MAGIHLKTSVFFRIAGREIKYNNVQKCMVNICGNPKIDVVILFK